MADSLSVKLKAPNGLEYDQPTGLWINNEWVKGSGEHITTIDPTTEQVICQVTSASDKDIDDAVTAARRAFDDGWRETSGTARGELLNKLAALVEENAHTLATVETWDNGKPYSVALNEDLSEVVQCLRYYAGWADKIFGQVIDTSSNKLTYTLREPIGVCGQIIPWNYPLAMASWKLGPALAAGNCVILKAAEQTPLSILCFANLTKEAGFPPGVVNIVNGYGAVTGAALVEHPDVDKIAFTGSTMTGKNIMRMAAVTMKNITLETGGKSPLIVFQDADVDQAVKWAQIGIMSNQGQVCCATSRILVHNSIYDRFIDVFKNYVQSVQILGAPFAERTSQGPQVTKKQYEEVLAYMATGKAEGARLITGGNAHGDRGFFVSPTIFADVTPSMRIFKEEVFGPFVVISSFETDLEAIQQANATKYGLGAAIFTRDIVRAHQIAKKISSGTVWINSSNDTDIRVPFGGTKMSGIGRELGESGLLAYTDIKSVHVNIGTVL